MTSFSDSDFCRGGAALPNGLRGNGVRENKLKSTVRSFWLNTTTWDVTPSAPKDRIIVIKTFPRTQWPHNVHLAR